MTTTKKIPIFVIGIIVAFVFGTLSTGTIGSADKVPETTSAEVGFARDMSIHHQQAIDMSFLIRERTDSQEIRNFAYDIINTQAAQRGMMLGWLDLWNLPPTSTDEPMVWMQSDMQMGNMEMMNSFTPGAIMPGMATREEMDKLRSLTGKDAEKLFLELMIRHHQGGVMMAQGLVDRSEYEQVVRLAQTMVDGQQSEIDYMQDLLTQYE